MKSPKEKAIMPSELKISVLLKKEGPFWVAQCLQHDVAGQGKSIPDACYQVERAVFGHVAYDIANGIEPLSKLGKAPAEYWTLWGKAEPMCKRPADPFGSDETAFIYPEIRVG